MIRYLFLFILILIGSSFYPDPFLTVLNRLNDPALQEKLVLFELRGLERKVNADYDTEKLIDFAYTFKGTPHKMGGTTKRGIDCSGFVTVVFRKFGVSLPHSAMEQARYGSLISDEQELQRGDLIFFCKSYKTTKPITHSGIYLGDGKFIHTSSSRGVTVTSLSNPWWNDRFLYGTRLKP